MHTAVGAGVLRRGRRAGQSALVIVEQMSSTFIVEPTQAVPETTMGDIRTRKMETLPKVIRSARKVTA